LIPGDVVSPSDAEVVIDARQPYREPSFSADGGSLPEILKKDIPLKISEGYCASYTWSEDRRTLLAYIYNVTHHTEQQQWLAGKSHRLPKPAELTVRLQNLPGRELKCRLYDLNTKQVLREETVATSPAWNVGISDHDYFVLVTR
jgi:hypothetical protein